MKHFNAMFDLKYLTSSFLFYSVLLIWIFLGRVLGSFDPNQDLPAGALRLLIEKTEFIGDVGSIYFLVQSLITVLITLCYKTLEQIKRSTALIIVNFIRITNDASSKLVLTLCGLVIGINISNDKIYTADTIISVLLILSVIFFVKTASDYVCFRLSSVDEIVEFNFNGDYRLVDKIITSECAAIYVASLMSCIDGFIGKQIYYDEKEDKLTLFLSFQKRTKYKNKVNSELYEAFSHAIKRDLVRSASSPSKSG